MKIKKNKEHQYRTRQQLEKLTNGEPKKVLAAATKYLAMRDEELIELKKIGIMQDLIMYNLLIEVEHFGAAIKSVVQDQMFKVKLELFGKPSAAVADACEEDILKYINNKLDRIRRVIAFSRDNDPYNGLTFEQIQLILHDSLIKDHYNQEKIND